ncbi:hypothetical protein PpBr36_01770 [Pyricularia pennisetigena]|uniref:hypothetical protein n=1 Tax=Pyricularia pennisetigena TaxID=1578925 RepID=UPI001153AF44|nr:hypothetical protein PpBr36_01770 [Pyricularia pennisetigena]TLS28770.1 hypothetical protein PpBr36_01770 [Pyricularia pennisetigena]
MASSGAARPAVSRVLQRCQPFSSSISCAAPVTTWRTLARPSTAAALPAAAAQATTQQLRLLSISMPLQKRRTTRDNNRLRGQSTIHRSGIRRPLSVSDEELPQPVQDEGVGKMRDEDTDPDHGLWGFFYDKQLLPTPKQLSAHGRSWTVQELRGKSWEDLHALWWTCCRERNRIATAMKARQLIGIKKDNPNDEAEARGKTVNKTMQAIKHVLTERFYAWEDARKLAMEDPEINLSGKGPIYTPSLHFESADTSYIEEPAVDHLETPETPGQEKVGEASLARGVDPSTIPPNETAKPVTDATRSS